MKKIFIVDDEPDITEVMTLFADQLGYTTDSSHSGDDAVGKIQRNDYWAVFCDLKMPGLSGLEIFEQVHRLKPELKKRFILVTGAILDKEAEEAVREKEIMVFRKPFNFEAIKALFSRLEKAQ
ncbi:MAG: response regulator [Thermodesulfovibrionales bacterium]|jgi:DNA-binding NtrC family response regulator